jgi:hypothetical protein
MRAYPGLGHDRTEMSAVDEVISLLDSKHSALVRGLRTDLERACGLPGLDLDAGAYFAYHAASQYDEPALAARLRQFARDTAAFRVRTSGLALVTDPQPVLSIQVVRSPFLSQVQAELWHEVQPTATEAAIDHAPQRWRPQIVLAAGPGIRDRLPHMVQLLAGRAFDWDVHINNLAFVRDAGASQEPGFRYPLEGHVRLWWQEYD